MAFTITNPLTTVFTPPADCNSHWTYEAEYYNSIPGGLLIQNCLGEHLDTACFPPGFDAFGRAPSTIQIYSPGYCPQGYATLGGFSFASTTTAICCPSGFSYTSTFSSINFFTTSAPFDGCISMYGDGSGQTTVLGRSNDIDLNTTTVSGPVTMWGQPITIEFQQADLSLFTTNTSSSSTSSASSTSASPTITRTSSLASQTATSTAVLSQSHSKTGISNGAIAGIAVAAAVILGILIGGAIFLRRKRLHTHKKPAELGGPENKMPQEQWTRGELDGTEVKREAKPPIQTYNERKPWDHNDGNLLELEGNSSRLSRPTGKWSAA